MLMSAFRAGLLGLGPYGIWGIKTAQFDLSAACERPVWARRWVANPEYIEALCVNPMCPIRICHKWACLGSKRPHFYVLLDGEKDRVGKFIFCEKNGPHDQKMPKSTPEPPFVQLKSTTSSRYKQPMRAQKVESCVFLNVISG